MNDWLNLLSLPTRKSGLKYLYVAILLRKWYVSSYAEEWIEMIKGYDEVIAEMSLPTRKSGLKLSAYTAHTPRGKVSSYAEEWIEISVAIPTYSTITVSSYAEEWIEILLGCEKINLLLVSSYAEEWIEILSVSTFSPNVSTSLPTRKSGLKFCNE